MPYRHSINLPDKYSEGYPHKLDHILIQHNLDCMLVEWVCTITLIQILRKVRTS